MTRVARIEYCLYVCIVIKRTYMNDLLDTLGRRNRKIKDKNCEHCGKTFRPIDSKKRACSRVCGYAIRVVNNPNKGKGKGYVNSKGYIEISIDGKRYKQHRYIMEQHLGRKLFPNEDIHHKNGIKTDNRIENLEVLDHSKHTLITNKERIYKKGYKMNISESERQRRSEHMKDIRNKQNK